MRAFEGHKKAFHRDSPEMHIELPRPLHQLTLKGRVEQGDLTISKSVCSTDAFTFLI